MAVIGAVKQGRVACSLAYASRHVHCIALHAALSSTCPNRSGLVASCLAVQPIEDGQEQCESHKPVMQPIVTHNSMECQTGAAGSFLRYTQ
jgi:hypothetical protein